MDADRSSVLSSALESYGESRVISVDIFKTFDRVWHKGLLAKLPMFGLHNNLIKWIVSFLFYRSVAIRIDGVLSEPHSVHSGVPQGSVISPVLFILFTNDLLSSTSSSTYSFADDTYLSSSFSSNPQNLSYFNVLSYRNTSVHFSQITCQPYKRGVMKTVLSSIRERWHRLLFHVNFTKVSPPRIHERP